MSRNPQVTARAYAAFSRGDLEGARQLLAGRTDAHSLHLAGLVEKRAGNLEQANSLLECAAAAAPRDAEIAHSRGQVARLQGRKDDAEACFRLALSLKPGFPQARLSLGRLLIDAGRFGEARSLYEALVAESPGSIPGRYGLGTVCLALGEAAAAERIFDELTRQQDRPEFRFMRARARLELARADEALSDLGAAHDSAPSRDTLTVLAGTLWMRGETEAFDRLIAEALASPALAVFAADILRQCALPERAVSAVEQLEARGRPSSAAMTVEALARVDLGQAPAAERAAVNALAADDANRSARAALISALLMQGRADEALEHIGTMRRLEPLRQNWIAYETTALRLADSPEHQRLADPDRFIRAYRLPVPPGYADLEQFNEALRIALERWHVYETHPLDQSLRYGSQTPRDLTTIDDPVIAAYVAALEQPIHRYLAELGDDPAHPLTARNSGKWEIAGCWSVRLAAAGRHVNHVHPAGWISSSYYVTVPPATAGDPARRGWIKFGEPPFPTDPPLAPVRWLCPEPGLVVLFPSYYWHGTEPVGDDGIRITAPFDVVPRTRSLRRSNE